VQEHVLEANVDPRSTEQSEDTNTTRSASSTPTTMVNIEDAFGYSRVGTQSNLSMLKKARQLSFKPPIKTDDDLG
jgi:N-acetylglucosamine-6-phosphate deacetylase